MPVVQVFTWELKNHSTETINVLDKARDILGTGDGFVGTWSGIADEDPDRFFTIIVWETSEHQHAFRKHPSWPEMMELTRSTQARDVRSEHVGFNHDFIPAVSAPTTEILHLTLKEGKTKEKLNSILEIIADKVNAGNEKHKPVTWGPTAEDPNKFYLMIGWDSMQDHVAYVQEPSFQPVLDELRSTAELVMFHVSLKTRESA